MRSLIFTKTWRAAIAMVVLWLAAPPIPAQERTTEFHSADARLEAYVLEALERNPGGWHWAHRLVSALHHAPAAPAVEKAAQLWTCGIHPQVLQDEPCDCPICFMKLTPLKGSAAPAAEAAQTTKERKMVSTNYVDTGYV